MRTTKRNKKFQPEITADLNVIIARKCANHPLFFSSLDWRSTLGSYSIVVSITTPEPEGGWPALTALHIHFGKTKTSHSRRGCLWTTNLVDSTLEYASRILDEEEGGGGGNCHFHRRIWRWNSHQCRSIAIRITSSVNQLLRSFA